MGLDSYVYKIGKNARLPDFGEVTILEEEFRYWRKFYDLENWMENLYHEKGGKEEFNCMPLRLVTRDLDRLEHDIQEDEFWKVSKGKDVQFFKSLKTFIQEARDFITENYAIYYYSSW